MRDLVVREGLEAMAVDAAERLRDLIADGEEIPYEVHEPGDGSPLCRYEPQTELFVRDHAGDLRELDSFGAVLRRDRGRRARRAATCSELGIAVPPEPRPRAELAGIVFLCRLWMDSSDFSLDARAARRSRSTSSRPGSTSTRGQIEVIVPLRGLQMPAARLDLAGASIVRADTVDVPPEARSSDGLGVSPWETPFLAVVRVVRASPTTTAARRSRPAARRGRVLPPADHAPCGCSRPAASASARTPGPGSPAIAGAGSRPAPDATAPAATG